MFGSDKLRYQGQEKNLNQFHVLAGFNQSGVGGKFHGSIGEDASRSGICPKGGFWMEIDKKTRLKRGDFAF